MRPWIVVAGGVHSGGGQDRANLELVRFLSHQHGAEVTLVAHDVAPEVRLWPRIRVHEVPKPWGNFSLGERLMHWEAHRVHASTPANAIVLANGGNYPLGTVNWMHCVHAVWPVRDEGAPPLRRLINRLKKKDARRREARAVHAARVILANSDKTARDVEKTHGVPAERIVTIQFGAQPLAAVPRSGGWTGRIGFVGALGWDRNKGLDVALRALQLLRAATATPPTLVIAGTGPTKPWLRLASNLGIAEHVKFLGTVRDMPTFLASLDLVVSPVRYEAYGLAAQEALVSGVPLLISAKAGIAQKIQLIAPEFLVEQNEEPKAWVEAILRISEEHPSYCAKASILGEEFVKRSWRAMAEEIVAIAEARA